jgi:hypothetical protein
MKRIFIAILLISILLVSLAPFVARSVFLSPSCYSDNRHLTDRENYFIKKVVLEAVEDRLSLFADVDDAIYDASASGNEIIQLDKEQRNRKHIFIFINRDFMENVTKDGEGYYVYVQTYNMESASSDCSYEIRLSNDFSVMFFGLDP